MQGLTKIKKALSKHFGATVTVEKLQSPNGSKVISRAKATGAYIAYQEGHKQEVIAQAFGYSSGKVISNIVARANKDEVLWQDIIDVQSDLSKDLE